MAWLRSSACQVRPAPAHQHSPFVGTSAAMTAYTTLGFEGATATATRPHGLVGRPLALWASSSVHDAPPSVVLNRPLPLGALGPSPPERNVHPLRRKSHVPAKSVFGF